MIRGGGNRFTDFLDFGLDLLDGGKQAASVGRRGMGRVVQQNSTKIRW